MLRVLRGNILHTATATVEKHELLKAYGVLPEDRLSRGMEAEVYALGEDAVLKLYGESTAVADLRALQHFYNQLDRTKLAYALPNIQRTKQNGNDTAVIEARLAGQPLADLVALGQADQSDKLLQIYVTAVHELSQLTMPENAEQYKLFDAEQISVRTNGDWHQFIWRYVADKQTSLAPYFSRDVEVYSQKLNAMQRALSTEYDGPYTLIHGDFCPANLLVDDDGIPTALIDFGLFTMYGDPLFDMATAWVFFDMYDERQANLRDRLLALILERFGEGLREKLYRYLLLYSLLSANVYSPECADGHYAWCIANLNNSEYWVHLL